MDGRTSKRYDPYYYHSESNKRSSYLMPISYRNAPYLLSTSSNVQACVSTQKTQFETRSCPHGPPKGTGRPPSTNRRPQSRPDSASNSLRTASVTGIVGYISTTPTPSIFPLFLQAISCLEMGIHFDQHSIEGATTLHDKVSSQYVVEDMLCKRKIGVHALGSLVEDVQIQRSIPAQRTAHQELIRRCGIAGDLDISCQLRYP